MIKVTTKNGLVIIATRADAEKNGLIFTPQSSTEAQPFVSSNFKDGVNIGGTTLTQSLLNHFIERAQKAGAEIEGKI